jgi:hypothetical protein
MDASSVPLRAGTLPRSMGWPQFATLVLSVLGLFSLIVSQASAPASARQPRR